ncbi:MAG: glycosyltransferase [Capsulimonadaceae bacterium]
MRIGIFSESYKPLINGVSTSLETLIAEIERAGHTVYVFTSHYPRYIDDRPGVFRFPSINSMVEPDYVVPIPISPRILRTIPTLGLDIVHSHSPFLLGKLARRVARAQSIPLISTNHTLYTEYAHYLPIAPAAFTRTCLIRWMHNYYNTCDQVIAPSRLTRDRLVHLYGVSRPVEVIPTGIPEPPYILSSREEILDRHGLPPAARVLLYVGRLAPEKNLTMLLDAFRRISRETPDTVLVIAGSGKSAKSLQKYTEKIGLASRVRFTGFLPRTRLDPLYQTAEVFMFPSKTETQGLAVSEALAAGTPCVVVNEGGAPESVSDGVDGFLVSDSAAEMARGALKILGDDDLRRRMGDSARVNAASLRPAVVAARVIEIYHRMAAPSHPPSAGARANSSRSGPPA